MRRSALKLGYRTQMYGKAIAGARALPVRPSLDPAEDEELRQRRPMGLARHPQPFSG
jgi:hypothetical protein